MTAQHATRRRRRPPRSSRDQHESAFASILRLLVARVPGARAAALVDCLGETVDYAGGNWGDSHEVVIHTLLAKPGTRAVVVQCYPGIVRTKAGDARDAIGIRMTNGPSKGRYGWVTSEDVHEIAKR